MAKRMTDEEIAERVKRGNRAKIIQERLGDVSFNDAWELADMYETASDVHRDLKMVEV